MTTTSAVFCCTAAFVTLLNITHEPNEERIQVDQPLAFLSERESHVAAKSAAGLTYREIADELCISPHTVRTHLKAIYKKLGVRNKAALIHSIRSGIASESEPLAGADLLSPPPCPYPGMVPFQVEDAAYFYGRESEIAQLQQQLYQQHRVLLIGPSGSGKSSLIYAGLLPALHPSGDFDQGHWLLRAMRPGSSPLKTLASLLEMDTERMMLSDDNILQLLTQYPPAQRLLLCIDQLEEVFTQASISEQRYFMEVLLTLGTLQSCTLLLVLRADFYPDLMNSPLWPIDAAQRIDIAPLRGDALRAAIEKPAAAVGVRLEDSLLNRLLADAAHEPGALPLLQETLGQLWFAMESRVLPYAAYEKFSGAASAQVDGGIVSGLAVAIARKADATLANLTPDQQLLARRIFLRLIQFGEGRADTRRQQPLSALQAVGDDTLEFERTLEHLTDHRLLTRSGDDTEVDSQVDIAHEALINAWSKLRDWVSERREAELTRRRLEGKAAEWRRLGSGKGALLDEAELPEAERWLASPDAAELGFDATLPALIESSRKALADARQAKLAAQQRELAQAQALADQQTRAARAMRRVLIAISAVSLLALVAAWLAWSQGQKAQTLAVQEAAARVAAEASRADAIAQLLLLQAPQQKEIYQEERSALLARQAYLMISDGNERIKDQADRVLRSLLSAPYFAAKLTEDVDSVAISPDGQTLVASSSAGTKKGQLLRVDLGRPGIKPVEIPGPHGDFIYALSFSPDGAFLVGGNESGALLLWETAHMDQFPRVVAKIEAGIASLDFSPDGHRLAIGTKFDDSVWLSDLVGSMTRLEGAGLGHAGLGNPEVAGPSGFPGGMPVAFSADGTYLVTGGSEGIIRLWDAHSLSHPIQILNGHQSPVWLIRFSPDGRLLASGDKDGVIRLWTLGEIPELTAVLQGHKESIIALAFSPDSATLASGGGDDVIRLWNTKKPQTPAVVLQGPHRISGLTFTPDGAWLISAADETGGLRLWDFRASGQPTVTQAHPTALHSLAYSPDGRVLATGGADGVARIWNLVTPETLPIVLFHDNAPVTSVNFSPDGGKIATTSHVADTIKLWRFNPAMQELAVFVGYDPWTAPFSPDGKILATNGANGSERIIQLWDVDNPTAKPVVLHTPMTRWINEIAFSPDGTRLAATGREGIIHIEDLTALGAGPLDLRDHDGFIWTLAFSPDSKTLASGGKDTTIRLWDLNHPNTSPSVLGHHESAVWRVRFSPDGKLLASSGEDGSVRLWNMENPAERPILLYGHDGGVWTVAFSPDGKTLASGGQDGTYRLWDLNHPIIRSSVAELAEQVCDKVWRNLSLQEWQQFIGEAIPYERTCSNLPMHPSVSAKDRNKTEH